MPLQSFYQKTFLVLLISFSAFIGEPLAQCEHTNCADLENNAPYSENDKCYINWLNCTAFGNPEGRPIASPQPPKTPEPPNKGGLPFQRPIQRPY